MFLLDFNVSRGRHTFQMFAITRHCRNVLFTISDQEIKKETINWVEWKPRATPPKKKKLLKEEKYWMKNFFKKNMKQIVIITKMKYLV